MEGKSFWITLLAIVSTGVLWTLPFVGALALRDQFLRGKPKDETVEDKEEPEQPSSDS